MNLIRKDVRASFEMGCSHRLVLSEKEDGCQCTMEYERRDSVREL